MKQTDGEGAKKGGKRIKKLLATNMPFFNAIQRANMFFKKLSDL